MIKVENSGKSGGKKLMVPAGLKCDEKPSGN